MPVVQWICLAVDCLNFKLRKPVTPMMYCCIAGIGQQVQDRLRIFFANRFNQLRLKTTAHVEDLKISTDHFRPQTASRTALQTLALLKSVALTLEESHRALALLDQAYSSWHFDAIAFSKATNNRPLSILGIYLFERLNLADDLELDWHMLARFLQELESGYEESNPYHNRAHAAAVMHAMHALVLQGGLLKELAGEASETVHTGSEAASQKRRVQLLTMACLFSAAVHDVEHVGLSNDFLVRTGHERAVRYKKQHVNENHHVETAFNMLLSSENNFLEHLPQADFEYFRSLVVSLVLSTDMGQHGAIMKSAQEAVNQHGQKDLLTLQLAMKCADLSHLALTWDLHLMWVQSLEEELFMQGDKEKELGLSISFLMDRQKTGVTGSQVGFFDAIVLPLFRLFVHMVPQASPMLDSVEANHHRWQELEAAQSAPSSPCG